MSKKVSFGKNAGFTLVELLVVIAIVGILIVMLLPAIQAAREAARQSQCAANLKNMGVALANYHGSHHSYPSARDAAGADPTAGVGVSWSFRLLPYMDQVQVHDAFNRKFRHDDPVNATAFRTPVGVFYCPSRRGPQLVDFDNNDQPIQQQMEKKAAGGDYAANNGRVYFSCTVPGQSGGCTTCPGQETPDGRKPDTWVEFCGKLSGPIYNWSHVGEAQVKDGLSNTFALGDKFMPDVKALRQVGLEANLEEPAGREDYNEGDVAFFTGDSWHAINATTEFGFPIGPLDYDIMKFGSEHPNIAQMLFLDGSVKVFNYWTSEAIYHSLATCAGNESLTDVPFQTEQRQKDL
jgi:prepilin-type N-terminal cleavage/methylation domain-containing protein